MRRFLVTILLGLALALAAAPLQRERDLRVRRDPKAAVEPAEHVPRGYAVIVGISRYRNLTEPQQLQFSETDAQAVYRELIGKEGGAFPAENVRLLVGPDATLANIRRDIEDWLPSVAQREDRVIVYFSGHGLVNRGRGYLAPWDLEPSRIQETSYPMRELGNVMSNRVKARWKALFTDACHSGKVNSETTNEDVTQQLDSSMAESQFLSFAATIGREKSYEDPNLSTGFGVFSYYLVQALKGNADNDPCDGWVRAGELVQYVTAQVQIYAKDHRTTQTPHVGGDYDPSMVLARSNGCGPSAPSLSTAGGAVIDVNLEDVDIWVDGDRVGKVGRGKPLTVPGLAEGQHAICGRKEGYEPDCRQVLIAPGQRVGVIIRIRYQRNIKPRARELYQKGERLLYTNRSTINPVNIAPVTRSQSLSDIRKAREWFTLALREDGTYSEAAHLLGMTNQLLSDEAASIAAFRLAIEIDPGQVDARVQYAGVLIENGDADEAIRQLTEALRFDGGNAVAHALLARAYLDKGVWRKCLEASSKALDLDAANATANLWRADCLRQLGDSEQSNQRFAAAAESYRRFLNLTNFSTPVYQWFAYHFIGFHLGGIAHPDRKASYENLRAAGFLGLCICERRTGSPLRAREYCRRALRYEPNDPVAHFVMGLAQLAAFEKTHECADFDSARASFVTMLNINPKLAEAKHARHYIDEIDGRKAEIRKRGCS